MTDVLVRRCGAEFTVDLSSPLSLAIPLDFDGAQPNYFGAPQAHAESLRDGHFIGDVRQGGSVNCEKLSLVAHCNGTHTECVGHVTEDRVVINEVITGTLFLTRVISLQPVAIGDTPEAIDGHRPPSELVVTETALIQALARWPGRSDAVIVRTLPNHSDKLSAHYLGEAPAPYFTPRAARYLAEQAIDHLVVDLPSLDRAHDDGRLLAHRAFWGMDEHETRASAARRPQATITELAWIAPTVADGWYLLNLQIPPFMSDAAPSRPILYRARRHE
jgi:kynurenine formamidase